MTAAKDGLNNEIARFDYDFERRRISKQSANGYESYVYAGSQIVNEFNASGQAIAKYAIGAGEIVKSEFGNGENNFHFTDALGSVTALTNATGSLTTKSEYDAFGLQSANSTTANSIGYTGQRLDNETGLMALGNGERYYSPNYARFIQQDSFVGLPEVPQSLNRFAYAHNNPTKHTDPSGNAVESVWDVASLIVGVGSLAYNLSEGNYGEAAIDALGVVADAAALALPGVPGGAGIGIKAYRAAKTTVKVLQTTDRAVNVGQGIVSTYQNIEAGNTGWAAVSGALTALGVGGLKSVGRGLSEATNLSDEAADFQKALNKPQDIFNAKNNPQALQELTQDAAKAQKKNLLDSLGKESRKDFKEKSFDEEGASFVKETKGVYDFKASERMDAELNVGSLKSALEKYRDVQVDKGKGMLTKQFSQMADVTKASGKEVALLDIKGDSDEIIRIMRIGDSRSVDTSDAIRVIAHTHPSGRLGLSNRVDKITGEKIGDIPAMQLAQPKQKSTIVISPTGEWMRFRIPTGLPTKKEN